jgi:diacylglycerol kinase
MGFIKSVRYALVGLWYILKSERNARIHLMVAALVFTAGLAMGLSNAELAAIFFAIIIVFLAEIINTAFEKTLDIIDGDIRPEIKLIKDMAAGAVLVASIGAVIIGVAIFRPYVLELLWRR